MAMIKYLLMLTRATSQGEGGMFALLSLLRGGGGAVGPRSLLIAMLMALFGAALLYGDGMITPAISVLSAVEGLKELNASFGTYVVPISCAILVGLFLVQRHGTERIGVAFGPIMILWFLFLGVMGCLHIGKSPEILQALMPQYGIQYLISHGLHGIIIMGMVLISFFYLKCIPCLLVIALGCFCLCLCEPYLNIPLWICILLLVLMGWRLTEKDFVVSWGGAAHHME
jgi:KUP system potassium uptake protein